MTRQEAEALAGVVRARVTGSVQVESHTDSFAVIVTMTSGRWALYDEGDWESWRAPMNKV